MVTSITTRKAGSRAARHYALLVTIALLAEVLSPAIAQAQVMQETLYDVYRIASEASVEVDNDRMIVTLVVEEEDKDAAVLANRVNEATSWAVDTLRPYDAIAVRNRDYQTYPRYENSTTRRLIGWRAQQIIELETDDFAVAGKAIQKLQEKLKVQNIRLTVKPATRKKASDILIENALNSFKERALLVQNNMNSTGFKVLDVDVRTQQNTPSYGGARMMSVDQEFSRAVETAPTIVGGTTTVYVQVEGRIQLD
ncbi:MAG: SIMPL domain-containing protein [Granulosicoccus sp.]